MPIDILSPHPEWQKDAEQTKRPEVVRSPHAEQEHSGALSNQRV
jgi:hypothetical protein